jgi:long-chain acyl-CoA synthetase
MIDDYGPVYSQNSIMICALPLYHCYGQNVTMITVIATGGTMLIIDRFSPDKVLDAITRHRATMFAGVPTMYAYLTSNFDPAKHDLSSAARFCISAGAGLPQEVRRGFKEKTGLDIVEGFGITEASAQALANPQTDKKRQKLGSVGFPFKGTEAKIVDDDGRELPPHAVGELVIKGDHVMKGYWKMPEETAKTIIDGWLHTGDLARMDEDGYIYIVDRKKDLIIVGGENVVPLEIEEVLYRNPKILEAAVVGKVDTVKGEIIKAVVVLKQGMEATQEELIEFCSHYLARFKIPGIVEFRDELPKSATGKILRKMLR